MIVSNTEAELLGMQLSLHQAIREQARGCDSEDSGETESDSDDQEYEHAMTQASEHQDYISTAATPNNYEIAEESKSASAACTSDFTALTKRSPLSKKHCLEILK